MSEAPAAQSNDISTASNTNSNIPSNDISTTSNTNSIIPSNVNWMDSWSVYKHYEKLIKKYLMANEIEDFTKFSFSLHGYHPVFSKWEYTDIILPCRNRLKRIEKGYYKFDLEDRVIIPKNKKDTKISRTVEVVTKDQEEKHFQNSMLFSPIIYGYIARSVDPSFTSLVNIVVNTKLLTKNQNKKWVLKYDVSANCGCTLEIRFSLKYNYFFPEENPNAEIEEEEVIPVNVNANVNSERYPSISNLKRTSSLRTSFENRNYRKVYPDLELTKMHSKLVDNTIRKKDAKLVLTQAALQKLNTLNG